MSIYYIDTENGNNLNDGCSASKPIADINAISIRPGDTILFKRGSFVRGMLKNVSGSEGMPVTYGAYGEGKKPVFCGSVDVGDSKIWVEERKNIWACTVADDETGNFVFNNGNEYGTFRWSFEELQNQGDFYDNRAGYRELKKKLGSEHKIYLYSDGNPGEYYDNIECVIYGNRTLAYSGHDMIFEELRFINSGVHAIAGEGKSRNITIRNCEFENIGGCVWDAENKVRFGNGVEFWNAAENIGIFGCVFNNIYDSAVTHQGGDECEPASNMIFKNNIFIKCGMAAYEQRDVFPKYAEFSSNICIDAGEGFSKQGEIMPRSSEIWPQPMGHHVFLWRINRAAENGEMIISDNKFLNAPYGAAIYSIISPDAEKQIKIFGNIYYTEAEDLLNRIYGKNYKDFNEYSKEEASVRYISQSEYKRIKEDTYKL